MQVVAAPDPFLDNNVLTVPRPIVFLGGSVTPGWRSDAIVAIGDHEGTILNPEREDFPDPIRDPTLYRAQIEWELEAQENADILLYYLDPSSHAPCTMMEIGLNHVSDGVVAVACPPGFAHHAYVRMVCERYMLACYDSLDSAVGWIRSQVKTPGST